MRKVFLSMAAAFAIATSGFAQTGKNSIGFGAEAGLSTAGGGAALGGTLKYLHGIGKAGQLSLTAGALFDSDSEEEMEVKGTQIPVLLGYRHNFNGLYVEPQLGYMATRVSAKYNGTKLFSGSDGAVAYGIGGGYAFPNGLDLGVSYRNGAKEGYSGLFVLRAGFNFSLGGAK